MEITQIHHRSILLRSSRLRSFAPRLGKRSAGTSSSPPNHLLLLTTGKLPTLLALLESSDDELRATANRQVSRFRPGLGELFPIFSHDQVGCLLAMNQQAAFSSCGVLGVSARRPTYWELAVIVTISTPIALPRSDRAFVRSLSTERSVRDLG